MARKYVDCRDFPQNVDKRCTVAISADSPEEVVEAAVQHAVNFHGHSDTPEFRAEIRSILKEGHPRT
ncbi:MAG: hypothetical protein VR64_16695 [Desulfatitalea sp. BRH_c12]|nr:MAG: hypothetical protein VR64_16695 [Desulfatitalea sp. BRH_c12]